MLARWFDALKGALSMAAVLGLPQNVPYRDRLVAIVFGVTLVTLVTQALPFQRFLLKALRFWNSAETSSLAGAISWCRS